MKKMILLVLLMFLNEHIMGQTHIRLSDGAFTQETKRVLPKRTVENVEAGILVTYEFDNVEIFPDNIFTNASIILIDGFGICGEIEAPALPLKIDRFSVSSKDTEVILLDSAYIELPMKIGPVRPPMKDIDNGGADIFIPAIRPYQGFFPRCAISSTVNAYRKFFIADVQVAPVQYDYQHKTVKIYSRLSYLIACGQPTKEIHKIKNDKLLSNIIMNPMDVELTSRDICLESDTPGYLILSVPDNSAAVEKFAEWKRTLGFDARTIYHNTWTKDSVTNAIASANIDNSLQYLLIVGDYEDIPGIIVTDSTRKSKGWNYYTYSTDYLYGCIQQNIYPDIRRGRLSVSSGNEAMTVVNKIIQYERSPVGDQSFYDTGINCAYYEDNYDIHMNYIRDSIEDVRFTLTSENIKDYLEDEHGKIINRVYKTYTPVYPLYWNNDAYGFWHELVTIPSELLRSNGYQWNGSDTDIIQHINEGAFYALHRGHGINEGWNGPQFRKSNINNLSNGNKLPVIFSMNCLTGQYNNDTCFAEAILRKENGGCVAIFAASESSLSGYNDALTIGMFDAIWPSNGFFKSFPFSNTISLSSSPTYRLGDILDIGLSQMSTIYNLGNNNTSKQHTKQIFHCFGDPAMEIYTERPTAFDNVSFTVVDNIAHLSVPEGGKITFYNPVSGNIHAYEGSTVQYPYSSNLRISITKHNKIPLIIENGTIFLQNDTITQDISYEANTIKVGTNVTSAKPTGDVIISGGVTTLKGNTVELAPGTTVEVGAQLKVNN